MQIDATTHLIVITLTYNKLLFKLLCLIIDGIDEPTSPRRGH